MWKLYIYCTQNLHYFHFIHISFINEDTLASPDKNYKVKIYNNNVYLRKGQRKTDKMV